MAMAHIHFMSIKTLLLQVVIWEIEKHVEIRSEAGLLVLSPSVSSFRVSLENFIFFIIRFRVWVSPTLTRRKKLSIDNPVGRPGWIRERKKFQLERPSWIQFCRDLCI